MRKVKVSVIASAKELNADVASAAELFRGLNGVCLDKDLFFTFKEHDYAGGSGFPADSDIVFFLFHGKTDRDMFAIYNAASEPVVKDGKIKTATYVRIDGDAPETEAIAALNEGINQEAVNYNTYTHTDTLKLGMLMHIKQLGLEGADIKLEDGKVKLGGVELLSLEHVETVSGHEELRRLKKEMAETTDVFTQAKTRFMENPEDNSAYEEYCGLSKRRNEIVKDINDIETRLYKLIESMYEQISKGELSKRQWESYWLIERGKYEEAKAILNFGTILNDAGFNDAAMDKTAKNAQILVNELLQLKDMNLTLADWSGVDACFKEAVKLEERYQLPKKAMLAYAKHLYGQNQLLEGIAIAEQLLYYYQNPRENISDADKGDLYSLLGKLYRETKRHSDADEKFKTALEFYNKMADIEPVVYEPEVAHIYNDLGVLYWRTKRIADSEEMFKASLDIWRRLQGRSPNTYDPDAAMVYNNLALLYRDTNKMAEGEEMFKEAIKIFTKMFEIDPKEKTEMSLAVCHSNLGSLYETFHRWAEAEEALSTALKLYSHLSERNPDAYTAKVARTTLFFAYLYSNSEQTEKAEAAWKRTVEVYKKLSEHNPGAYTIEAANAAANLGVFYHKHQRAAEAEQILVEALDWLNNLTGHDPDEFDMEYSYVIMCLSEAYVDSMRLAEAEELLEKAMTIVKKLVIRAPELYETYLAVIYSTYARIYKHTGKLAEAENACRAALRIHDKYQADNPQNAELAAEIKEFLEGLYDLQGFQLKETLLTESMNALFTPEEREIALFLTEGDSQRDIARRLSLTAAEVSRHVNNIRDKMIGAGVSDPDMAAIVYKYKLSRREANILRCLRQDMTNAAIAAELFIAEETVRVHVHKLLKKLPVANRQDVSAWVKSFAENKE